MNILHIVPSYKPAYGYGGTIESTSRLCEQLAIAGHTVTVFTTTANGKTELDVKPKRRYEVEGVSVFYFKRITKDPSHVSPELWLYLRKYGSKFDIVHLHSWWNILIIVAAQICKKKKFKTIFSPHGMFSDYILQHSNVGFKKIIQPFTKQLLRYMTLHATSFIEMEDCQKILPGWTGFIAFNIVWLPEIIIRKKAHDKFCILFLSRIHPKKGIELLMESLSKTEHPFTLQIAGDGDEKYILSLRQKAKCLGIEDRVEWLGWMNREEKFTTLMNADLLALTSYNENFANVVVEALHAGTPVLLSTEVGLSKFIAEKNLGWICTTDPIDIKEKLQQAIDNPECRHQMSKASHVIVKEQLSGEVLITEYIENYRKIIDQK